MITSVLYNNTNNVTTKCNKPNNNCDKLPNQPNNNFNKTCNNTFEFDLYVEKDKIVVANKEFNNLSEAVRYLVKQSRPYSYNVRIVNYSQPTPNKIHVVTQFDELQPTERNTMYYWINPPKEMIDYYLKNISKYVKKDYGKFADLKITGNHWENVNNVWYYKIYVSFIDIPDLIPNE